MVRMGSLSMRPPTANIVTSVEAMNNRADDMLDLGNAAPARGSATLRERLAEQLHQLTALHRIQAESPRAIGVA